ncbi:hypothetical protein RB1748 [Rhodopirellula baltica SH 1]|uniref:Uncharacterized protein n=1 Tax=Rhodopirellula baltica (strain DSM 10527 / NCIMB 13988 / SH1) TaxID=243090 RepID=Q7UWW4_RHOBA|nr:hypothetical protein RB1748 [Rhodopirellula baltica SH 1]
MFGKFWESDRDGHFQFSHFQHAQKTGSLADPRHIRACSKNTQPLGSDVSPIASKGSKGTFDRPRG